MLQEDEVEKDPKAARALAARAIGVALANTDSPAEPSHDPAQRRRLRAPGGTRGGLWRARRCRTRTPTTNSYWRWALATAYNQRPTCSTTQGMLEKLELKKR